MIAAFRRWVDRYLEAYRHVLWGREVIGLRDLIARKKATGRNTDQSEELLVTFERTQSIFEDDLARITRERGEVSC
jgi:hypothetical protein